MNYKYHEGEPLFANLWSPKPHLRQLMKTLAQSLGLEERRTRKLLTIFEQNEIYRYIELYGAFQGFTLYDSMFAPSGENEVKSWKMTTSYHIT